MGSELLVQFATVFLGAFLAFWLENVREQRKLKTWVNHYLRQIYDDLGEAVDALAASEKLFRERLEAYQVFLEATSDTQLDEETWRKLTAVSQERATDFMAPLSGEALRVLPPQLSDALTQLQQVTQKSELFLNILHEIHARDVMPIYYDHQLPLSERERRQLGYFRLRLNDYLAIFEQNKAAYRHCHEQLGLYLDEL